MKKAWIFALGLLLTLATHSALAVKVNSLYQGEIPVSSQSLEERKQAMQQALAQVLIKVSGNNQIINNPRIKARLHSAETLVQEFGYSPPRSPGSNILYLLQIRFEANGVNHWLRDASAPIWGQNRPLVLGWIVSEKPQHAAEIISLNSSNNLVGLFKQNADRRGIPFRFPIMDATDTQRVTVNDITTMATSNLIPAAKRYATAAILIGHIIENPNGFTTQWKLLMDNDQWDWSISGNTITDVIPTIIDNVSNTLASRYAVVTTNTIQKNIALKVVGITQQGDFTQLIRYLNHLTPVANVGILRITGNEILLSVSLRSTQQSFVQAISLGQRLTPIANEVSASPLIYQWNH